ncbi:hypothetical protein DS831_04785 [Bombilactobacillus bombi]|uniref:Uncharacterized protein n=1 Tax=Bombilactobacillus bombi TaxID=1303590 RepID=A0A417ZI03_9LACO|nr:hypothetical protein [Bombilactobacillus bombi]RHW51341.1 hypothetical protein DS831_04785 [Bombilactobacillus bombi]
MNDLQKAQAFLRSGDFSIEKLAKQIGSSSRQIRNYIDGKANLSSAKWAIVNQLAKLYDKKIIGEVSTSPDFLQFISIMGGLFKDISDRQNKIANSEKGLSQDKLLIPVIQKMNERFTKDTDYTVDLYKIFKKTEKARGND